MISRLHPDCTLEAYGGLSTDKRQYRPLDTVRVTITGRASGDQVCRIRVHDSEQVPYFEADLELTSNRGELSFTAAGSLGAQYIYLYWPQSSQHSRYLNFLVEAETEIECGDPDFDQLYPRTRELLQLARREYHTPRGKLVAYACADTWHFDGIWLRDWIYGLPAYQYWETEMTCGIDRFLECQSPDGRIPDGIERNGKTWRVELESDVEYIMTMAVYQAWQATGDEQWLAAVLPKLEQALSYIRKDSRHWDEKHQLVKRQHSCDTWDFDIDGAGNSGQARHVIATCDQTGYLQAFRAMSKMYRRLGQEQAAAEWDDYARQYRERAVKLLWDGGKFQHHVHLDQIDHGDFDESRQLAMSNTWAMTRGLANPQQAALIIDEYQRRQRATNDAYPWWSLQPGYPDHLGYFAREDCKQGGYANGGLIPWVGGELCRGALRFGREAYGVELLRQYADHLRRNNGLYTWYWLDGEPGFRTTNEVPYFGWGMAAWTAALIEGLAGIRPETEQMRELVVAPAWAAAGLKAVRASARYAASRAYFTYHMVYNPAEKTLVFEYSGSGRKADFRVLLPAGLKPTRVEYNGAAIKWQEERIEDSNYLHCQVPIAGLGRLVFSCPENPC